MIIIYILLHKLSYISFQAVFDRPGYYRFYTKNMDKEYGMVKEEVRNLTLYSLSISSFRMLKPQIHAAWTPLPSILKNSNLIILLFKFNLIPEIIYTLCTLAHWEEGRRKGGESKVFERVSRERKLLRKIAKFREKFLSYILKYFAKCCISQRK